MLIYKTRIFSKWALKEGITDNMLKTSVYEISQGLVDANLGGNIYKKRVAVQGKGKSGSSRTLIAYRFNDKAFFIYGFMKNERANINAKDFKTLKLLADEFLNYSQQKLQNAVKANELIEVI